MLCHAMLCYEDHQVDHADRDELEALEAQDEVDQLVPACHAGKALAQGGARSGKALA